MKFASWFGALVAASVNECGPVVVKDGHFPDEFQAAQKTYSVDHAILFDITYAPSGNFKVLNNKAADEQYVLTMCDSKAPTDAEVDAVSPLGKGFTRKHFMVPFQTFGSTTSGNVGYLGVLGVYDRQKYISKYSVPPCLVKAHECAEAKCDQIENLNECAENMRPAQDFGLSDEEEEKLNKEQTASVDGMFGSYGDALNPKVIAVTDYLDPHPLNKAEWTKFIGAFFNLEDVAEKYMKEQEKRWDALVKKGNADATKPLVAFISASSYYGQYRISLAAYKTELINDAGGKNFKVSDFDSNAHAVVTGTDPNPTIGFNMTDPDAADAFRAAVADVKVFIDESSYRHLDPPVPQSYTKQSFQDLFGFDGNGARIYKFNKKIGGISKTGTDWYTGARSDPAGLLSDFVAAIHSPTDARTWLQEISPNHEEPTLVTSADCDKKLPVCDGVEPVSIAAPCDRCDLSWDSTRRFTFHTSTTCKFPCPYM